MDQRYNNLLNQINSLRDTVLGLVGGGGNGISEIVGHKYINNASVSGTTANLSKNYDTTINGFAMIEADIIYSITNSSAGNTEIQLYKNDIVVTSALAIWTTNPEVTGNYEHHVRFFTDLNGTDNVSVRITNANTTTINSSQCIMTLTKLDNGYNITEETNSGGGGGGGI